MDGQCIPFLWSSIFKAPLAIGPRGLHGLIKHFSLYLRDRVLTYGTMKSHIIFKMVQYDDMLEYQF